jgi:hypothetical protein
MNSLKIASWLPIQDRLEQAKAYARNIASRHDVPAKVPAYDEDGNPEFDAQGKPIMVPIASDLRDVQGRWWGTREGRSLASVILINEVLEGSQSAITPVLMGMVSMLTVISVAALTFGIAAAGGDHAWLVNFAKGIAWVSAASMLVLFTALWSAIGAQGNRMVLMGSVILPAFGMLLEKFLGPGASGAMTAAGAMSGAGGGLMAGLTRFAIPVAVVAFAAFLFVGKRDTTKQLLFGAFRIAVFFIITATIAKWILPGWAQPLYWAFLGCAVPVWWNHKQEQLRALQLLYQSKIGMGDLRTLGNTNAEKRQRQAEQAEKDKSGFIPLGRARGVLTTYGDGYSPDEGLILGLTCHELRTHFHGFGKTGGGKTFNLFTPIIQWWARHGHGGVLVLDGKGAAGDDLIGDFIARHGLKHRALLIKPGIQLGLMEGLTPNDFIDAIFDIGGARNEEQSQNDSEKFFITQARTFGLSVARVLWALVEHGRGDPARKFFLTIDSVDRLKVFLKADTTGSQALLKSVESFEAYASDVLLRDAVRYIKHDFWTQPTDQAGGIVSTFDNTIKDLLAHPELRAWASMETGVDCTIPTTGGFVAVSLPEVKYGQAGKLVQSLIKQRLFIKIRRRGDYNWRAAGETPVLFAVDESQEMISKADRDFLPQSRGLGGYAAYFTQSVDAYESRMGDASTRSFLDSFRSSAAFESSPKTYEFFAAAMGQGRFITWGSPSQVINYLGTAQMVASSPLHDNSREDARFMRKMRRRGAGRVIVPSGQPNQPRTRMVGRGETMTLPDIEARMLGRSYHDPSEIHADSADQFTFTASVSGEVRERTLLMLEDCAKHLNSEQDAIVSYRRGGARRHDFVSFDELSPDQIKENESQFHRALVYNAAVHIFQRDMVEAMGERPSATQLRRLTQALIHLLLNDQAFLHSYEKGELKMAMVLARVEKHWTRDQHARSHWRATSAIEREAFIDRYLAELDEQKLAA